MLIPKNKRYKDKKHLMKVASLPCISCGIEGASQAAHVTKRGHSKIGGKDHDYFCIPLCHEGANNCHKKFDAYEILDDKRDELREIAQRLFGLGIEECKKLVKRKIYGL